MIISDGFAQEVPIVMDPGQVFGPLANPDAMNIIRASSATSAAARFSGLGSPVSPLLTAILGAGNKPLSIPMLSVRAIDPAGKPVPGLAVTVAIIPAFNPFVIKGGTISSFQAGATTRIIATAKTNSTGTAVFRDIKATGGSFRIRIENDFMQLFPQAMGSVEKAASLTIRIKKISSQIKVVDDKGIPQPDAALRLELIDSAGKRRDAFSKAGSRGIGSFEGWISQSWNPRNVIASIRPGRFGISGSAPFSQPQKTVVIKPAIRGRLIQQAAERIRAAQVAARLPAPVPVPAEPVIIAPVVAERSKLPLILAALVAGGLIVFLILGR